MKKKAVIYARYSTEMQSQGHSIEGQILEGQRYISSHDMTFVGIYKDEGVSGQKANREGFVQVVEDARKGLFDVVVVHMLTRATRFQDLFLYYEFKHNLAECGVEIHSTTENIRDNDIGELIEFLSIWQSKNEIKKLGANVSRSLKYNATKNQFNGGYAPLGYKIVDKMYVIDENESEVVKKIFDLYLSGCGYFDIAARLNNFGYKTRFNKPFGKNSIYEILHNVKYIGTYKWNSTPKRDEHGHRNNHSTKIEDVIVNEKAIPAIIEQSVFEEVQKKMDTRKRVGHTDEPYLLSGILYCGDCGESFGGKYQKYRNKRYYVCGGKASGKTCSATYLPRDLVENAIIEYLEILNSPENRKLIKAWFENNLEASIAPRKADIETLEKQVTKMKNEAEKVIDLLIKKETPMLLKKLEDLEFCIKNAEEELQKLYGLQDAAETIECRSVLRIFDQIVGMREKDRADQRIIIHTFIKKIIVIEKDGEKRIDVTTNLPFLFGQNDVPSMLVPKTRLRIEGYSTLPWFIFTSLILKK